MVFLSHGVIPISYRKIRGHRHTVLLTPTVGLYEAPHTKNVMAITKKRFYPRAFNVISARLEGIREPGPLERHRRGRLQHSKKIARTRRPGLPQVIGQLVSRSVGQSVSLGRYRIPA